MLEQNNILKLTFDTFIVEHWLNDEINLDLVKGPRELYLALIELGVQIEGDSVDTSVNNYVSNSGVDIYVHKKKTFLKVDKKGLEYYATVNYQQ